MGGRDVTLDDSSEPISSAIVSAVADREGVDPSELDPPLQSVVDMDALNHLFDERSGHDLRVEFRYAGYEITVRGPDRIDVQSTD